MLKEGDIIDGNYRIERKLGDGASGYVFLARDLDLDRAVAIKVLLSASVKDGETVKRFEREAKILSSLLHPNIVRVYKFGYIESRTPYLVMEYVEGITVRQLLEQKTALSCNSAMQLMQQLCSALSYAHSEKITHRDLKPENLLLAAHESGFKLKLVDFGLGKQLIKNTPDKETAEGADYQKAQLATLTRTGSIIGTPLYMSPEQCLGKSVDLRSDIYSLGCILYELITGSPPFMANSQPEVLLMHLSKPTPRLFDQSPDCGLPIEVQELILKATAKKPEDRFQSCREMEAIINEILKQNCNLVFADSKTARKNFAGLASVTKAKAGLIAALSLLLISGLLLFVLKYNLQAQAGSGLTMGQLRADEVIQKTSSSFKKTLADSQANPAQALNIAEAACSSAAYKSWSSIERVSLLSVFSKELDASAYKNEGLKYKIMLLEELMKFLENKSGKLKGKRNNQDSQDASETAAKVLELNELCKELSLTQHSKSQWNDISRSIDANWRQRTGAVQGLQWLWALRCISWRERGVSEADRKDLAKLYAYAANAAASAHDREALELIVQDGSKYAVACGAFNRANVLHVTLGDFYLKRGELEKARAQLAQALNLSKDHVLSGAESGAQERLIQGLKAGHYIARKSGPHIKKPMPEIYKQVLGQD